ncbi:MAG TPA: flagellar hook-basal body protein [Clostridiales bacterium]|nr:flagellar hook-basal body protein [Clostridiales bacterium]
MQAIYTAATGLKAQQNRLDTIAANISNVNTVGYKSTRVDFKDALYNLMENPAGDSMASNLLKGSGVLMNATTTDFSEGRLETTNSILDFAIIGEGFFTLENTQGEILYTRNGSFSLSAEEDASYLVSSQGYYVLDRDGNRIALPKDLTGLNIANGTMLRNEDGELAALGIVTFPNNDGLLAAGETCYRPSETAGEPTPLEDARIEQGKIESSNVDLAQELTLLIRSQRAYSLASRALKTADDMDGLANNIR